MPNIKSAKKRVLVSAANYERNKAYRSGLKTAVKKANAAIESGAADADVAVKAAVKDYYEKNGLEYDKSKFCDGDCCHCGKHQDE